MPSGEAWFINIDAGEQIDVYEHMSKVRTDPVLFGLTPEDITDRRATLLKVLGNGCINPISQGKSMSGKGGDTIDDIGADSKNPVGT